MIEIKILSTMSSQTKLTWKQIFPLIIMVVEKCLLTRDVYLAVAICGPKHLLKTKSYQRMVAQVTEVLSLSKLIVLDKDMEALY